MRPDALEPYERALLERSAVSLVTDDGCLVALDIGRYLAGADAVDQTVLDRCVGPVLDVGCGPGRIVTALAEQGIPALGVDIAEVAVALTLRRGAPALSRDVFDRVPGEGRWPTVLVLDGNIGIGGDVAALLVRLAALLGPSGALLVEVNSLVAGTADLLRVRFTKNGTPVGPEFGWSIVSGDVLAERARSCGLACTDQWSCNGREFLRLVRDRETR